MSTPVSEAEDDTGQGPKRAASTNSFNEEDTEGGGAPLTFNELVDDKGEIRDGEPVYELIDDEESGDPVVTSPEIGGASVAAGGEALTVGPKTVWGLQNIERSIFYHLSSIERSIVYRLSKGLSSIGKLSLRNSG